MNKLSLSPILDETLEIYCGEVLCSITWRWVLNFVHHLGMSFGEKNMCALMLFLLDTATRYTSTQEYTRIFYHLT